MEKGHPLDFDLCYNGIMNLMEGITKRAADDWIDYRYDEIVGKDTKSARDKRKVTEKYFTKGMFTLAYPTLDPDKLFEMLEEEVNDLLYTKKNLTSEIRLYSFLDVSGFIAIASQYDCKIMDIEESIMHDTEYIVKYKCSYKDKVKLLQEWNHICDEINGPKDDDSVVEKHYIRTKYGKKGHYKEINKALGKDLISIKLVGKMEYAIWFKCDWTKYKKIVAINKGGDKD